MKKSTLYFIVLIMFIPVKGIGQNQYKNTISYDSITGSPKATLNAINWIAGSWEGEAFGGITEEVWTPPLGNSMMCVFKLIYDEKIKFYEIVTISEEDETLILRLKHFNSDLKGWELKDETIDFKLVKVTEDKVYFDEFTFERISANEINIYVVIEENGKRTETRFNYTRKQL